MRFETKETALNLAGIVILAVAGGIATMVLISIALRVIAWTN